jgi:dinuclear metal center YbgI/SA1388 family protein
MDIAGLLETIDAHAPWGLAEEWDNVGLIVGRRTQPVRRVLVALDLRQGVLDEAQATGANTILVHHPPIFPSITAVSDAHRQSSLVLSASEMRIAVIAAHTNLDSTIGGLNDQMARLLGLTDPMPLVTSESDPAAGLGRVGPVAPAPLRALVARVRTTVTGAVTWVGSGASTVSRMACCSGSGASLLEAAKASGADVYVTSDLKYHDADRAEDMALICVPHGQIEALALAAWTPALAKAVAGVGVAVAVAGTATDPWTASLPATL